VRQFIEWMLKQAEEENRAGVEQIYGRKRVGATTLQPPQRKGARQRARS
jgi:hypothetical protein